MLRQSLRDKHELKSVPHDVIMLCEITRQEFSQFIFVLVQNISISHIASRNIKNMNSSNPYLEAFLIISYLHL